MRTFLNYLEVTIFAKIKNWFQILKVGKNIRFKFLERMKIKEIEAREYKLKSIFLNKTINCIF